MQELDFQFKDILQMEHPELILKKARPFMDLMMEYQCALMEVETKLNVLNEEFAAKYQRNPFESIKSRIKEPLSIINKMKRKGFELSVESMEKNLFDIAGIRVICSFCDDIYAIASMLTGQDDIILVDVKDYIKNPKPNGYRSLHLILDIPHFPFFRKETYESGSAVPYHCYGFLGKPGTQSKIQKRCGTFGRNCGRAERMCRRDLCYGLSDAGNSE